MFLATSVTPPRMIEASAAVVIVFLLAILGGWLSPHRSGWFGKLRSPGWIIGAAVHVWATTVCAMELMGLTRWNNASLWMQVRSYVPGWDTALFGALACAIVIGSVFLLVIAVWLGGRFRVGRRGSKG